MRRQLFVSSSRSFIYYAVISFTFFIVACFVPPFLITIAFLVFLFMPPRFACRHFFFRSPSAARHATRRPTHVQERQVGGDISSAFLLLLLVF